MRLLFRQRFFSWFDSYDIYGENGETMYTVEGQLSWGHLLRIYDSLGNEVGMVKERVLTWLPRFEIYVGGQYAGCITREFSLFTPHFSVDCNGWQVEGNWLGWDYTIVNGAGAEVARVSKELFRWTDTYVIDVGDPCNGLMALMLVLAIDAEKCSRK